MNLVNKAITIHFCAADSWGSLGYTIEEEKLAGTGDPDFKEYKVKVPATQTVFDLQSFGENGKEIIGSQWEVRLLIHTRRQVILALALLPLFP